MEQQWIVDSPDNTAGILLRLARISQGKGQKEVCHGLCVVSYLSKIERGKGNPDTALLGQLFGRLGITYETEKTFWKRAGSRFGNIFTGIFMSLKEKSCLRN